MPLPPPKAPIERIAGVRDGFPAANLRVSNASFGCEVEWIVANRQRLKSALTGHQPLTPDWCEPFNGCYLYYSSRRQPSAAFSLILDALRYRGA